MISIVIPTFNRWQSLVRTLESIEQQDVIDDNFEVIVVDDGSADGTGKYVEDFRRTTKITLKYYYQHRAGPGKARNLGVEKAEGDIILFCGDDTIFDRDMLSQHDISHKIPGTDAVLGLVLWNKEIAPNDFMNFLAPCGPLFHFNTIKNINDARFSHFYTANISLKRKWLIEEKFDESLKYAVFDDIDLGLRLEKKNFKITYNKHAIVYHLHYYTPELFYQRMIRAGESFAVLKEKYKNDKLNSFKLSIVYAPFLLLPFGLRLFKIISGTARRFGFISKISPRTYWGFSISYFYAIGIMKGLKK